MADIFTPFLFAFILAYILRPISLRLENLRLGKAISSSLAILLGLSIFAIILLLLINLLRYEIPLIKSQLPIWLQNLQTWLAPKLQSLNVDLDWPGIREAITQELTAHFSANQYPTFPNPWIAILISSLEGRLKIDPSFQ